MVSIWRWPDGLTYRIVYNLLDRYFVMKRIVDWISDCGVCFGRINDSFLYCTSLNIVFQLPSEYLVLEPQLISFLLVVFWVHIKLTSHMIFYFSNLLAKTYKLDKYNKMIKLSLWTNSFLYRIFIDRLLTFWSFYVIFQSSWKLFILYFKFLHHVLVRPQALSHNCIWLIFFNLFWNRLSDFKFFLHHHLLFNFLLNHFFIVELSSQLILNLLLNHFFIFVLSSQLILNFPLNYFIIFVLSSHLILNFPSNVFELSSHLILKFLMNHFLIF